MTRHACPICFTTLLPLEQPICDDCAATRGGHQKPNGQTARLVLEGQLPDDLAGYTLADFGVTE